MTLYELREPPQRIIDGPLDSAMYVPTILAGTQRAEAGWYLVREPLEICPLDQYGNPVQFFLPLDPETFQAQWVEVAAT